MRANRHMISTQFSFIFIYHMFRHNQYNIVREDDEVHVLCLWTLSL
jgi:hypothetical protein